MGKHKAKTSYRPGDPIYISVKQEHIDGSDPCNKDNCMLTRALVAWLVATYGDRPFKVKSTNHGAIFHLNGREIVVVFDRGSTNKIYKYDAIYTKTRNKSAARSAIKPFTSRVMVEATRALPQWPAMSEETKEKLKAYNRKRAEDAAPGTPSRRTKLQIGPRKGGARRELSL